VTGRRSGISPRRAVSIRSLEVITLYINSARLGIIALNALNALNALFTLFTLFTLIALIASGVSF
jgi:hypothetical protein